MSLFFRRGSSSTFFVPTIAAPYSTVTAAALTAGVELSAAVSALGGFSTSLNRINAPVQKYKQAPQIDGPQTFADTTVTLYDDDGTGTDPDQAAREASALALAEGTIGFLVLCPTKILPVAGDKVEIWPIRVGAVNPVWALDEEPARTEYALTITSPPNKAASVSA